MFAFSIRRAKAFGQKENYYCVYIAVLFLDARRATIESPTRQANRI